MTSRSLDAGVLACTGKILVLHFGHAAGIAEKYDFAIFGDNHGRIGGRIHGRVFVTGIPILVARFLLWLFAHRRNDRRHTLPYFQGIQDRLQFLLARILAQSGFFIARRSQDPTQ